MGSSGFKYLLCLRLCKIIFNIIILYLYRNGDSGGFMGGSHNRSVDREIFGIGIYVGYFIYTSISLIVLGFQETYYNKNNNKGKNNGNKAKLSNTNLSESVMNFLGAILWFINSTLVLQFWISYVPSNQYGHSTSTNPKITGIMMGILTLLNCILYGMEGCLSARWNYRQYRVVATENVH